MKNCILYLFLVSLSLLASCTPEPLDVKLPTMPSVPVLASQFYFDTITQQSAVVVTLTKSLDATDGRLPTIDSNGVIQDKSMFIQGAAITITIGANTYEFQEMDDGMYYAINVELTDFAPCKIEAKTADGKLLVESNTYAMPQKDFEQVDLTTEKGYKFLSYRLKDATNERNWYLVNYLTKQKQDSVPNYNDPRYIAKRLTEQKLDFDLYTDKDFTDGALSVRRNLGNVGYDTVALAVSEISEGYYQFLSAQKKYGALINQLKGEVINFPTNVKGGMGYFTIHQPKLRVLVVQ